MLVQYTRPAPTSTWNPGGFHAGTATTQTKVEELPDTDETTDPPTATPIPAGATLAPAGSVPHDWQ